MTFSNRSDWFSSKICPDLPSMETKHPSSVPSLHTRSAEDFVCLITSNERRLSVRRSFLCSSRYLRRDTLAMLLSLSNVHHQSNVAVVESCQGLILASVIQRCAGDQGLIFNLTPAGEHNSTLYVGRLGSLAMIVICLPLAYSSPCCDFMDFPEHCMSNVYTIPIENVGKCRAKISLEKKNDCFP